MDKDYQLKIKIKKKIQVRHKRHKSEMNRKKKCLK